MVFVVLGLAALVAYGDLKTMRIPNIYAVIVTIAFFVAFTADYFGDGDAFSSLVNHFAAFVLLFIITLILFVMRVFGGGDAKIMPVYALWLGMGGLISFLFYTALIGFFLALFALAVQRKKPFKSPQEGSWLYKLQAGDGRIPYGVAIAGGVLAAFIQKGYLGLDVITGFL